MRMQGDNALPWPKTGYVEQWQVQGSHVLALSCVGRLNWLVLGVCTFLPGSCVATLRSFASWMKCDAKCGRLLPIWLRVSSDLAKDCREKVQRTGASARH